MSEEKKDQTAEKLEVPFSSSLYERGVDVEKLTPEEVMAWKALVDASPNIAAYSSNHQYRKDLNEHLRKVTSFCKSVSARRGIHPQTEIAYQKRVAHLEEEHGSLLGAIHWLSQAIMGKESFSKNRSALLFVARKRSDKEAIELLTGLRQEKNRMIQPSTKSRNKHLKPEEIEKLIHWLDQEGRTRNNKSGNEEMRIQGEIWINRTITFLRAASATGLRPIEWQWAKLIEVEGFPHLQTQNAKIKFQKAATERLIPLDTQTPQEIEAIQQNLKNLSEYLQIESGSLQTYQQSIRRWVNRAQEQVLPNRKTKVDLYSLRHAYHYHLVELGIPQEEIHQRMGHKAKSARQYGGGEGAYKKSRTGGKSPIMQAPITQESVPPSTEPTLENW